MDESTFIDHTCPIVQPNKESFSAWKQAITKISKNDGTLQQTARWTTLQNSNRKTILKVNTNHTGICINKSASKHRYHTIEARSSSYRHKR